MFERLQGERKVTEVSPAAADARSWAAAPALTRCATGSVGLLTVSLLINLLWDISERCVTSKSVSDYVL